MKVALLGYGTVGRAFYALAKECPTIEIAMVFSLAHQEGVTCPQTTDIQDVLRDESIDLVVELIGGLHPAYEYVTAAMLAKKHVVTANKYLMCTYYTELVSLSHQQGVSLRCAAAAGGGIPWLPNLRRAATTNRVTDVWGIMNGTTNYILSAMAETGEDYDQCLQDAQRMGFAEADPTADISGLDAKRKLVLSANIGFEADLDEDSVLYEGIGAVTASDIHALASVGRACKLIAHAHRTSNGICAVVEPMAVLKSTLLANVGGEGNLIALNGSHIGVQRFVGAGAGGFPTASNVLADCQEIARGCSPFYVPETPACAADNTLLSARYYFRGVPAEKLPATNALGDGFVTEKMTVEAAHQLKNDLRKVYPDLFMAAFAGDKIC